MPVAAIDDTERAICAVLLREAPHWNGDVDPPAIGHFLEIANYHGVLPLLATEFRNRANFETWPEEILLACREALLAQTMYELAHRAEITRVLDALASADVKALLLKGTALAYSHYPSAALRPRGDTDLLISPNRRKETEHALDRLGYAKREAVEGEFVTYQATWSRSDQFGATHQLDVHWRINNSQILAGLLSYDELAARAVRVPALGPSANMLAPVDALLFACIHRAGHVNAPYRIDGVAHFGIDRLIWLYDIHLLVSRMSAEELNECAALAGAKQIKTICRDALHRTSERFATPVPSRILEVLNTCGSVEPSARFLTGGRIRLMVGDFRALENWGARLRWVKELAFPLPRYMRSKYPDAAITWLPILYIRRGLNGITRLIFSRNTGPGH